MEAPDNKPRVRRQSKVGDTQPPAADAELTLPVEQDTTPTATEAPAGDTAKSVLMTPDGAVKYDY